MLPRHTIERLTVKPRRGRPHNADSDQEYGLLLEFNGLREKLLKINEYEEPLWLKSGETRKKFVQRLAHIIQRLHLTTLYCLENPLVSGKDIETSDPYEVLTMVQRPLEEDIASRIAGRAVRGKRLSKNKLLYSLLAFYICNDIGKSESIRGKIEQAKKKYPEECNEAP
jgi:hypothetical protein